MELDLVIQALLEQHRQEPERHEPDELLAVRAKVREEISEAIRAEHEVAEEPEGDQPEPKELAIPLLPDQHGGVRRRDHEAGDPCQRGQAARGGRAADAPLLEEPDRGQGARDVDRLGRADAAIEHPARRQKQEHERQRAGRRQLPDVAGQPVEDQNRATVQQRSQRERALVADEGEQADAERIEREIAGEKDRRVDVGQERVLRRDAVEVARNRHVVRSVPEPVDGAHVVEKGPVDQEGARDGRERQSDLRPYGGASRLSHCGSG